MSLENLRRETDDGFVEFYADAAAWTAHRPTVTLKVKDGVASAYASVGLPTHGWRQHARAYARADMYVTVKGLTDAREQ